MNSKRATGAATETKLLVQAFIDGDDEALDALYRRYEGALRGVINAYLDPRVRRRVDDSDLIQMTWLSATKQLRTEKRLPDIGLLPMVRNIAKERVIDMHRVHRAAQKRGVYSEEASGVSDASVHCLAERLIEVHMGPKTALERDERNRLVHDALERLNPEHREMLMLRFLEQLKLEDCAEVLLISVAAAKSRQRRALAAFGREIQKDLSR